MPPPPTHAAHTGLAPSQPQVGKPSAQRYRRGKLPLGLAPPTSDSDDDDDDEEQDGEDAQGSRRKRVVTSLNAGSSVGEGGPGRIIQVGESSTAAQAAGAGKRDIQIALRDVKVEEGGALLIGGKREVGRTEMEDDSSGEEETDDEEEEEEEKDVKPRFIPRAKAGQSSTAGQIKEESEYETDSEEESSEEESEEEPQKPIYRPTFVPKRARETILARDAELKAQEEAEARREQEMEERKKQSREILGESIRKEIAEREAAEVVPDVDDTDGLDPQAEFDDWRLRELARLTRDKEAAIRREEERLEVERRREMPEEQRLAEDLEHARRTREEKPREERGFLEKYYHRGAFHQDEDIVQRRIIKTESSVDMSMLPAVMQVRDFGKRSRTKYTHLKDQDTTGDGWNRALKGGPGGRPQQEGCFNCGGPHLRRDCPNPPQREAGPTGANTSSLGYGSFKEQRHSDRHPSDDRDRERRRDDRRRSRSPDRGHDRSRRY